MHRMWPLLPWPASEHWFLHLCILRDKQQKLEKRWWREGKGLKICICTPDSQDSRAHTSVEQFFGFSGKRSGQVGLWSPHGLAPRSWALGWVQCDEDSEYPTWMSSLGPQTLSWLGFVSSPSDCLILTSFSDTPPHTHTPLWGGSFLCITDEFLSKWPSGFCVC